MDPFLLILLLAGVFGAWREGQHRAVRRYQASRTAKVSQVTRARGGKPLPPAARKQVVRRHAAGYWSREAVKGFPETRTGLHAGWLAHRIAVDKGLIAREKARTEHLKGQVAKQKAMDAYRKEQGEALKEIRGAIAAQPNPPRGRKAVRDVAGDVVTPLRRRDGTLVQPPSGTPSRDSSVTPSGGGVTEPPQTPSGDPLPEGSRTPTRDPLTNHTRDPSRTASVTPPSGDAVTPTRDPLTGTGEGAPATAAQPGRGDATRHPVRAQEAIRDSEWRQAEARKLAAGLAGAHRYCLAPCGPGCGAAAAPRAVQAADVRRGMALWNPQTGEPMRVADNAVTLPSGAVHFPLTDGGTATLPPGYRLHPTSSPRPEVNPAQVHRDGSPQAKACAACGKEATGSNPLVIAPDGWRVHMSHVTSPASGYHDSTPLATTRPSRAESTASATLTAAPEAKAKASPAPPGGTKTSGHPGSPGPAPHTSQGGTPPVAETNHARAVALAELAAQQAEEDRATAEARRKEAEQTAEQMQALDVDSGALTAYLTLADLGRASEKAAAEKAAGAQAALAALKKTEGVAQAHREAPVRAAKREFYEGG